MKMDRLFLFVALLLPVAAAQAQDSGFYLGASVGQSTLRNWCDPSLTLSSCEDKDVGWKLLAGYQFNRYFGVEASYIDWGETTVSISSGGQFVDGSAKQQGYGIAAVGTLPLGQSPFSLFGKIGLMFVSQETARIRPNPSTVERDETETQYGVGAKYRFAQDLAVRAEMERTDKRQGEQTIRAQLISIGLEYRF